jgi:hypothetical protein
MVAIEIEDGIGMGTGKKEGRKEGRSGKWMEE